MIFSKPYLKAFSKYKPQELKILIIDNAGFHSTKNIHVPKNIKLINLPPYSPELNPAEKIWGFLKLKYKNKVFGSLDVLRKWLHDTINKELSVERVLSITNTSTYNDAFKCHFKT